MSAPAPWPRSHCLLAASAQAAGHPPILNGAHYLQRLGNPRLVVSGCEVTVISASIRRSKYGTPEDISPRDVKAVVNIEWWHEHDEHKTDQWTG